MPDPRVASAGLPVLALVLALLPPPADAADAEALVVLRRPLTEAAGAVRERTGLAFTIDPALADAQPVVSLQLRSTERASGRQALAHAAGLWWLERPMDVLLTRSDTLPVARNDLRVESRVSELTKRHDCEAVIAEFLAPWLGHAACGVGHDPFTGVWSATLDPEGHAELRALLGILEHGQARVPALLPLPAAPPDVALRSAIRAGNRHDLLMRLAAETGVSVALGPGIHLAVPELGPDPEPLRIGPGPLPEICRELAQLGIHHRLVAGVLCFDTVAPEPRRHPARRRRLAVLPVGHLLDDPALGVAFAVELTTTVNPTWWERPGAGLVYLERSRSLLVAADAPTMRALLEELLRRERGNTG